MKHSTVCIKLCGIGAVCKCITCTCRSRFGNLAQRFNRILCMLNINLLDCFDFAQSGNLCIDIVEIATCCKLALP